MPGDAGGRSLKPCMFVNLDVTLYIHEQNGFQQNYNSLKRTQTKAILLSILLLAEFHVTSRHVIAVVHSHIVSAHASRFNLLSQQAVTQSQSSR